MKILQVNKLYHPWIGGVETVVKQYAEGLVAKGITCDVLAINENRNALISEEIINDVKVTKAKLNFFLGSQPISFSFLKSLKKSEADIYHIHLPNPLSVIAWLMIKPKGKLVITYHSDIIKQKFLRFFYYPFLFSFLKRVNKIIVTSPNLIASSYILKHFRNKIVDVPLSISLDEYKIVNKEEIEKIKKRYGQNYLLAIGRLVKYKGFHYLINAMKYVEKEKLYIIGEGRLKRELIKLIRKNNLEERIIIIPPVNFEQLKAFFKLSKFFILPSISKNEAFGIVQLEAMYFGKPVISFDLPTGVTYVNKHEKTGIVVKNKTEEELAKAISNLIEDKKLYANISNYNNQYIVKNYSEKNMIDKIFTIYKNLINE